MSIEFRPLSDALGAEVVGVDVAGDLSDETIAEIRAGWLQHSILLFRNQQMTRGQQKAFTQRFGELMVSPNSRTRFPEHPEVLVFSNIKVDGEYIGSPPARVGEGWHSDFFYLKKPAGGSFFYAMEAPEKGGETWFANMTKAYEALPEDKKAALADRRCEYSQQKTLQILNPELPPLTDEQKRALPDVSHPMVRVHPETGCTALFVGLRGTPACRVDGMSESEGIEFLEELRAFATQSQFTYAHQWRPGDAMLWDNRCTMHRATVFADELGRRLCYRTTTEGGAPY
jgi:taurine dioxygenase